MTQVASFTSPTLNSGNYAYRILITQDNGCDVVGDSIAVNVLTDPTITIAISDTAIL